MTHEEAGIKITAYLSVSARVNRTYSLAFLEGKPSKILIEMRDAEYVDIVRRSWHRAFSNHSSDRIVS